MGRTRRKSGARKTVECLTRCLNEKLYPLVLKWKDPNQMIFSILFKHKKSCNWNPGYLAFFKELDRISVDKCQKYQKEIDPDQACKRRCKANLRKLCKDGVLEIIDKKKIDKTTEKKYYKFSDISAKNETTAPTEYFGNYWINNTTLFANNEEFNHVPQQAAFENEDMKSENSEQTNTEYGKCYEEDENNGNFYIPNNIIKDNLDSGLNGCYGEVDLIPAVEESIPFDPTNCNGNMKSEYAAVESNDTSVEYDEAAKNENASPFLSNLWNQWISGGMDIAQVADSL